MAFLLGHVLYIAAFATLTQTTALQPILAMVLLSGFGTLPKPVRVELGQMKLPVCAYAVIIAVMPAYAVVLFVLMPSVRDAMVLTGGLLFSPIRKRWLPAFNLVAYYSAQILLAMSTLAQ